MNILYINHENALGGGSQSLLGIIDKLKEKEDINIYVAIPKVGEGQLETQLINRKIKYIKLNYKWWMSKNNKSTFIKKSAIKTINYLNGLALAIFCKVNKINVIHTNSTVINIGGIVSKLTGIKHIWHIREFGEEDHKLNFVFNKEKSLKFINKSSTKIVAISKSIYDKYSNDFDEDKLVLIYNGVPFKEMPQKEEKSIDNINILLAGAIKESKGQEKAILALDILINKGYENIRLSLAGNEEDGYGDYLRTLIKERNLINNVNFLGYINNVNQIRSNYDIELVCSKKEAFGRVTIEAMMSRNIVIGANTGGTKELINHRVNGMLYDETSIVDLADRIEYVINNPLIKKQIEDNAYDYALNNFTSKINSENIYKLYREV